MKIQVNTDKNIEGREPLVAHVEATITRALGHLSEHVTRVEVHLSDENGGKAGAHDKRCMIEARLEGRQPTAVTCEAATLSQALDGAADKLKSSLHSTLGRLHDHR
jgi:ribosome-associated translation inhibitor RaiA